MADPQEIIRAVYESVLGQGRWEPVLSMLTDYFGGSYSVVLAGGKTVRVLATDLLSSERRQAYENYYAYLPPSSVLAQTSATLGCVVTDRAYADYRSYLSSELYNEFFRPLNSQHMMCFVLGTSEPERAGLIIRRATAGFFEDADIERFEKIGHHAVNAGRLSARFSALRAENFNLRSLTDALRLPVFVVQRDCRVRHMTSDADLLLFDGRAQITSGKLSLREPSQQRELANAVRECVDSIDGMNARATRALRVAGLGTLLLSAALWNTSGGQAIPACIVRVSGTSRSQQDQIEATAKLFGLTSGEVRMTVALCGGISLTEYSQARQVSIGTARNVLKSVLSKTGAHSQAQLVAMVLGGSAKLLG